MTNNIKLTLIYLWKTRIPFLSSYRTAALAEWLSLSYQSEPELSSEISTIIERKSTSTSIVATQFGRYTEINRKNILDLFSFVLHIRENNHSF